MSKSDSNQDASRRAVVSYTPKLAGKSPREYPTVRECMDQEFLRLTPHMHIYEAVDLLLKKGVTGAAVVDDDGALVGILSEKDCLRVLLEITAEDRPAGQVAYYMTTEVETILPDADVVQLAQQFLRSVYRRVLVVDEDGRLCGQITRRDLLRAIQGFLR